MTETFQVKLLLIGTFGTCFISKMDDKSVTVFNNDRKTIDNAKITGGTPPYFDKKVVGDEELVEFAIEIDNVMKWYMSPEERRQWPPRCVTKIAKNVFCKRDLWYEFQEKMQTLYRIINKKDQGETE